MLPTLHPTTVRSSSLRFASLHFFFFGAFAPDPPVCVADAYPMARNISITVAATSPWNVIAPFSATLPPHPSTFLNFCAISFAASFPPGGANASITVTVFPFVPLRVTPTRTLCAAMSTPTLAPAPAPIALGGFFAPPPRVGAAVVFDDFDFARSAFIAPPLDSAATASDSLIRVIDEKDDDDDDDRSVASFAAFDAAGKDDFSDARSPNGFAPGGVDFFPPPPFAPAKTRTTRRIVVVVVVDIAEEEEEEDDDDDAVRLGGAPRASRHPTRALARARDGFFVDRTHSFLTIRSLTHSAAASVFPVVVA